MTYVKPNEFVVFQDDNGFISATEMRQFMNMLNLGKQFTDQDLRKDFGNDGKISTVGLAVYLYNNQKY